MSGMCNADTVLML